MRLTEAIKKRGKKTTIIRLVIALIIAVGVFIYSRGAIFGLLIGPTPLDTSISLTDSLGDYVSYDADFVVGEYVRNITRTDGVDSVTSVGYIIYDYDNEVYFCIKRPGKNRYDMDKRMDASYDFFGVEGSPYPETLSIKGTLQKIPSDEMSYYTGVAVEFWGDGYEEFAFPYVIVENKVNGRDTFIILITTVITMIALCYSLYMILKITGSKYDASIKKYIKSQSGITMEQIEADFAGAEQVGQNGIWIGKRWTIYMSGSNAEIIDNADLVWAYYYRRTGRYYESSIRTYNTQRRMRVISVPERESSTVLNNFAANQPHIVIGYEKQLEKVYNKEFQTFLTYKFNPAKEAAADAFLDGYSQPEYREY